MCAMPTSGEKGGKGGLTYRVKMSLVTAAMLYSSRRARQSFNIRAVLPDPTGLYKGRTLSFLVVLDSNALAVVVLTVGMELTHQCPR